MGSETKRTHFCGRAIEHGIGVCQTETCETCPLALPPFATPTPAADGSDFAKADKYARDLIAAFSDSDVQEAVESVAVSRAYLALRARPLPDDVRAVVRKAVDETLAAHHLHHTQDDLGNGYPLVDALTPDVDDTTERGAFEIELLADDLVDAVLAHLTREAPDAGA